MPLYIADDNGDFAQIERHVAEREGWKATICSNGRELAAEVASENGPALLIVDINMPELDGIEVIDELKLIERHMRVRFITGGLESLALRKPNPLIDGFPTYWGWLQRVLNPGSWKFDRNLVAVAQGYGVISVVAA